MCGSFRHPDQILFLAFDAQLVHHPVLKTLVTASMHSTKCPLAVTASRYCRRSSTVDRLDLADGTLPQHRITQ